MNALDSPLEALAINYLNYGVLTAINNVWAWIAVFTAAVSFWKIRASVSLIIDHRHTFLPPAKHVSDTLPSSPSCTVVDEQPSISESAASLPATRQQSGTVETNDGQTKGKFVVYYGGADVFDDESCDGDYDVAQEAYGGEWLCEDGWETVLRMKTGELGWYRYQDLTVFDGNVVRLWDDCRRRNGYPSTGGTTW